MFLLAARQYFYHLHCIGEKVVSLKIVSRTSSGFWFILQEDIPDKKNNKKLSGTEAMFFIYSYSVRQIRPLQGKGLSSIRIFVFSADSEKSEEGALGGNKWLLTINCSPLFHKKQATNNTRITIRGYLANSHAFHASLICLKKPPKKQIEDSLQLAILPHLHSELPWAWHIPGGKLIFCFYVTCAFPKLCLHWSCFSSSDGRFCLKKECLSSAFGWKLWSSYLGTKSFWQQSWPKFEF